MSNMPRSRILIVDDELEVARKFQRVLEGMGEVKIAERESEIFEQIRDIAPQLLVLDIVLEWEGGYPPWDAGVHILRLIRSKSVHAHPVIVITARVDPEVKEQCEKLGIVAFLRKPFSIHELRETVERALKDFSTNPKELLEKLVAYFDLSEIDTLCFKLNISYQAISGSTLEVKARELIAYLQRRGRLHELVELCRKERPYIPW